MYVFVHEVRVHVHVDHYILPSDQKRTGNTPQHERKVPAELGLYLMGISSLRKVSLLGPIGIFRAH